MADKTWIWAQFLEKLGGLVKGIGSLLIETGKALRISGKANLED
jgi:hypothetical protein